MFSDNRFPGFGIGLIVPGHADSSPFDKKVLKVFNSTEDNTTVLVNFKTPGAGKSNFSNHDRVGD